MNSKIFFAGGCFWCTEAIFRRVEGVGEVLPGYIGGHIKNPSYKEVCSGRTGHAEAVSVEYDDKIILLEKLLLIFFKLMTLLRLIDKEMILELNIDLQFFILIKNRKTNRKIYKKIS